MPVSRPTVVIVMLGAVVAGAAMGVGSAATDPAGRDAIVDGGRHAAVTLGLARARPPRAGDHWRGCNDVRAAGAAPIYRGEPGYRVDMDGDGDGIACEPVRR